VVSVIVIVMDHHGIIKPSKDGVLERFEVWMDDGVTHGQRHTKGEAKGMNGRRQFELIIRT
jgi:hypothetical protein